MKAATHRRPLELGAIAAIITMLLVAMWVGYLCGISA